MHELGRGIQTPEAQKKKNRDIAMLIISSKRIVAGVFRGRVHIDQFAVVECTVALLVWAISLTSLHLLWCKCKSPLVGLV